MMEKADRLLKVIESRNNTIEELSKERNLLQYKYDALVEVSRLDKGKIARLGKEISRLNSIIHDKNEEIEEKGKGCVKVFNENLELRQKLANILVHNVDAQALKSAESALRYKDRVIKDKDAVLHDVAEELRLSKMREEELLATVKDYLKEIDELKKKVKFKPCSTIKEHHKLVIPHNDFMQIIRIW